MCTNLYNFFIKYWLFRNIHLILWNLTWGALRIVCLIFPCWESVQRTWLCKDVFYLLIFGSSFLSSIEKIVFQLFWSADDREFRCKNILVRKKNQCGQNREEFLLKWCWNKNKLKSFLDVKVSRILIVLFDFPRFLFSLYIYRVIAELLALA